MGDNFVKSMNNISQISQGVNTVVAAGIGIKNALSPKQIEQQGSAIGLRSGGMPGIGNAPAFNSNTLVQNRGGGSSYDMSISAPNISGGAQMATRKTMPDHYGTLMDILKIYRG